MNFSKWFACVAVALSFVGTAHAVTIVEDFSTDPSSRGWVGVGNTTSPNNYGWSSATNFAGGATGEAGGSFQARVGGGGIKGYWDSTLGGTLPQSQPLMATGIFTVDSVAGFDGGFDFGFLNVTSPTAVALSGAHTGGYTPMVGFRFNDNLPGATTYRLNAHMAFGTTVNTQRVQGNLLQLDVGTDYKFTLTYDPNGGGAGLGVTTVAINKLSDNSLVGTSFTPAISSTGTPISLDAFGFSGLTFPTNSTTANIFVDDLEYTAAPEPGTLALLVIGLCLCGRPFGARRP
jgi:PEP-CTERM motif